MVVCMYGMEVVYPGEPGHFQHMPQLCQQFIFQPLFSNSFQSLFGQPSFFFSLPPSFTVLAA